MPKGSFWTISNQLCQLFAALCNQNNDTVPYNFACMLIIQIKINCTQFKRTVLRRGRRNYTPILSLLCTLFGSMKRRRRREKRPWKLLLVKRNYFFELKLKCCQSFGSAHFVNITIRLCHSSQVMSYHEIQIFFKSNFFFKFKIVVKKFDNLVFEGRH